MRTDLLTFHGGCPVLAGSKWITNKWIRQFGQYRNFPCALSANQMVRFGPVSNDLCKMTDRCDNLDLFEKAMSYKEAMLALARDRSDFDVV